MVPGSHEMQELWPASASVPSAHGEHSSKPPVLNVFFPQSSSPSLAAVGFFPGRATVQKLAPADEYVPTAHGRHSSLRNGAKVPLSQDAHEPSSRFGMLPGSQFWQLLAPGAEKPPSHGAHSSEPPMLNVLVAQLSQAFVAAFACLPAPQKSHAMAPFEPATVPSSQIRHSGSLPMGAYEPSSQETQVRPRGSKTEPGAHGAQDTAPFSLCVPSGQGVHVFVFPIEKVSCVRAKRAGGES